MPSSNAPFSALAYVVKLTFSGQIPALGARAAPTGWVKIANVTTGLVLDSGGNVASGSNLKQWSYDGSTNLQWQLVDLGSGYYRIVNRTNGMVADSWGNTANGAPARQTAWNGGNNQQWRLNSVGNSRYQIINRGTGTALDGSGQHHVRLHRGACGRRTPAPTTSGPSPACDHPGRGQGFGPGLARVCLSSRHGVRC